MYYTFHINGKFYFRSKDIKKKQSLQKFQINQKKKKNYHAIYIIINGRKRMRIKKASKTGLF